MAERTFDRVMVSIANPLGKQIQERAKAGYRSTSMEVTMLLERALKAEANEKGA